MESLQAEDTTPGFLMMWLVDKCMEESPRRRPYMGKIVQRCSGLLRRERAKKKAKEREQRDAGKGRTPGGVVLYPAAAEENRGWQEEEPQRQKEAGTLVERYPRASKCIVLFLKVLLFLVVLPFVLVFALFALPCKPCLLPTLFGVTDSDGEELDGRSSYGKHHHTYT